MIPLVFGAQDPGVDSPEVARIQPLPQLVIVAEDDAGTAITRAWHARDVERCALCPKGMCSTARLAGFAVCLVTLGRHVADSEAALARYDEDET
jgi:hypothetical protein